MGNKISTEDEEYELLYEGKKSRFKNMTEYENLTSNDRLQSGAMLPVKKTIEGYEIENHK
jgi:hypothetical protein